MSATESRKSNGPGVLDGGAEQNCCFLSAVKSSEESLSHHVKLNGVG